MQLFFRVEGNEQIGLGHLMRCFALSQAAHNAQHEFVFICNQVTKNFLLSRHQWQGKVVVIDDSHWTKPATVDYADKRNKLDIQLIIDCMLGFESQKTPKHQQILVLDGYQFDHSYQEMLAKTNICFAYLDDINSFLGQDKQHVADVLINGAAAATALGYEKNAANSHLCLGPQYLLLRPEFLNVPLVPISNRDSLLICFGGADSLNHTLKILGALSELDFQSPVTVVTGAAYKGQQVLIDSIQSAWLNYDNKKQKISMPIHYVHDAQDMADIMSHSRLCVSAAGGTQFELMQCYTPSFLVVVADNQMPAATRSASEGWCYAVDWRHQVDYIGLAKQVFTEYIDTDCLIMKQKEAYKLVQDKSSYGANNLLKVFNELLNLRC